MKTHIILRRGFRFGAKEALDTKEGFLSTLSLKDAEIHEDGTFSGYASVFGEVDEANEVVTKGAFKASLLKWAKQKRLPAMLWQHDRRVVIGIWTRMVEDAKGLYVEGKLALDTEKGAEAYALLKMGALDGLSIGYVCTEWRENTKTGLVMLDVIDLWEVSLVTFPCGPSARVDGVKSIFGSGRLPSVKELEQLLREAGCSRSMAKAIAAKGLGEVLRQREADSEKRFTLEDIRSIILD